MSAGKNDSSLFFFNVLYWEFFLTCKLSWFASSFLCSLAEFCCFLSLRVADSSLDEGSAPFSNPPSLTEALKLPHKKV